MPSLVEIPDDGAAVEGRLDTMQIDHPTTTSTTVEKHDTVAPTGVLYSTQYHDKSSGQANEEIDSGLSPNSRVEVTPVPSTGRGKNTKSQKGSSSQMTLGSFFQQKGTKSAAKSPVIASQTRKKRPLSQEERNKLLSIVLPRSSTNGDSTRSSAGRPKKLLQDFETTDVEKNMNGSPIQSSVISNLEVEATKVETSVSDTTTKDTLEARSVSVEGSTEASEQPSVAEKAEILGNSSTATHGPTPCNETPCNTLSPRKKPKLTLGHFFTNASSQKKTPIATVEEKVAAPLASLKTKEEPMVTIASAPESLTHPSTASNCAKTSHETPEKAGASAAPSAAAKEEVSQSLTKEFQDMLARHERMRQSYRAKGSTVLEQCQQLRSELMSDIALPPVQISNTKEDFIPDKILPSLLALVEGQSLPLSQLVPHVCDKLERHVQVRYGNAAVEQKIKLVSSRKQYLKNPHILLPDQERSSKSQIPVDPFEDVLSEHMWRWEATLVDVLPDANQAKKDRAAFRKVTSRLQAIIKLLGTLNDVDEAILKGKPTETLVARLAREEDRVLKFEREAEKARIAKESKLLKEKDKGEDVKRKELEKLETKRLMEEKRKEKERLKQLAIEEKQRKKEEAERLKAELKQKKECEIQKIALKKKALLEKQKNCMLGFFANGSKSTSDSDSTSMPEDESNIGKSTVYDFDLKAFRQSIGSSQSPGFSFRRRRNFKRRIEHRKTTVYETVSSEDDPFGADAYAEEKEITVRLPKKFLRFHEDVRPPYDGTWSKKSPLVTGRKPFGKDVAVFEYDYDSECEWEEGDDEIGEDVDQDMGEDDDNDLDEGEDPEAVGWLAAEDDIGDDADEETMQLRKQKLLEKQLDLKEKIPVIIGPMQGRPLQCIGDCEGRVQNVSSEEALEILSSYTVVTNDEAAPDLEALFAAGTDDDEYQKSESKGPSQELSPEEKKEFARLLQGRSTGSKEKAVDEIREALPYMKISRAQTLRHLESIGEKIKHPMSGSMWQVKPEILKDLGLADLIDAAAEKASDEMQEVMIAIARFIHHSTCNSKEKLVEQLQSNPLTSQLSKSETTRIIDSIAEKKKHPKAGYYWEVTPQSRTNLLLTDLQATFAPPVELISPGQTPASTSKASGEEGKVRPELDEAPKSQQDGSPKNLDMGGNGFNVVEDGTLNTEKSQTEKPKTTEKLISTSITPNELISNSSIESSAALSQNRAVPKRPLDDAPSSNAQKKAKSTDKSSDAKAKSALSTNTVNKTSVNLLKAFRKKKKETGGK